MNRLINRPELFFHWHIFFICHLGPFQVIHSLRSSNYHRIIGDFQCGVNAPLNSEAALSTDVCWAADQTHQFKLKVNQKRQHVAMQVLVHMPG